jgi:hypothetical protein
LFKKILRKKRLTSFELVLSSFARMTQPYFLLRRNYYDTLLQLAGRGGREEEEEEEGSH